MPHEVGMLVYDVVRRVDITTGSEIVVAGNGTASFSGDGGVRGPLNYLSTEKRATRQR
jgi:hypothetical protein